MVVYVEAKSEAGAEEIRRRTYFAVELFLSHQSPFPSKVTPSVVVLIIGDGTITGHCQEAARYVIIPLRPFAADIFGQSYSSNTPTTRTAFNN